MRSSSMTMCIKKPKLVTTDSSKSLTRMRGARSVEFPVLAFMTATA
tara:strand:- start:228 stop:365 length:138 start_codon:yes stop_codon:yes gene_type:complete